MLERRCRTRSSHFSAVPSEKDWPLGLVRDSRYRSFLGRDHWRSPPGPSPVLSPLLSSRASALAGLLCVRAVVPDL